MSRETRFIKEGRSRFLNANVCIDVLLKLKANELLIQKREYPKRFSTTSAQLSNKIRKVVVYRNDTGGLGLTIKGGAEHGLPILISKILNNDMDGNLQLLENEDSLCIGDAILEINGEDVQSLGHKQVVSLLKSAGNRVELKVKFYQPAFHYLTLQRESQPRSSMFENEEKCIDCTVHEKKWTTFKNISLAGSYLFKKCNVDDESLPDNSLLIGSGNESAMLKFDDHEIFDDWMNILRKNINSATKHLIHRINANLENEDQITYMAWVRERTDNKSAHPTNIRIRGDFILLSKQLSIDTDVENDGDISFKVYECLMVKKKKECIALKHLDFPTKLYTFDSNMDFQEFLKVWHTCNYSAVTRLKRKNFEISSDENPSYLSLDFENSTIFLIIPDTQTILWIYKLSQIKGYHLKDNFGISFDVWNRSRTDHEQKILKCDHCFEILCYLNSFVTAKLASLDPMFLLYLD